MASKSLMARIERLEAKARQGRRIPGLVLHIDGKPIDYASCGKQTWERVQGESEEDFKSRVYSEADGPVLITYHPMTAEEWEAEAKAQQAELMAQEVKRRRGSEANR